MESQEATVYLATTSEAQQFDVLVRGFEIFRERSQSRGDLWKDFHIQDATHHIASKLARITAAVQRADQGILGQQEFEQITADDALDIINYAAFIVRHAEKIYP